MRGLTSYIELLDCLRMRFDAWSARAVLHEALEIVGLPVKALYRPEEVETLAHRLSVRKDRVDAVVSALRRLATESAEIAVP